jgi:uncharacterized CHY-type Zn-finger protein
MRCDLWHQPASGLICLRLYTPKGIKVCEACHNTIDHNRRKPYSKIIDKVAIAEVGWYVNRKLAGHQI